jgi:hypothetical protein
MADPYQPEFPFLVAVVALALSQVRLGRTRWARFSTTEAQSPPALNCATLDAANPHFTPAWGSSDAHGLTS